MKEQPDEGDAGRESKVPCTEKGNRERGMPSTASELEAVPTIRMGKGKGKGVGREGSWRVVEGHEGLWMVLLWIM